jgi:STE24 endopeptidase
MRYFETPIYSELLFFLLLGIFSFLIGLPESIYRTFFLEEKFGFNRTTISTFIFDIIKGFILSVILGTPILFGVLKIMEFFSSSWWFYAFLFLSIVQFIIIFIYPRFIAPLFNKFTLLEEGELKNSINNLLLKVNYSSNGIFIMDASKRSGHGNAYFTGFGKEKRIVFFDTLINTLNKNEIIAVLAHELGHMKLNHIIVGLVKSLIFSFISFYIVGLLKDNHQFLNGHGIFTITNANTLAILSMIASVYTFWLTPIEAFLSRKNEYEADKFASIHANSNDLISALIKMYSDNKSFLVPDRIYSQFYYSHPSAIERVQHLQSIDTMK